MENGYIKLHRQILDSSVFANATGLKIWIWCLLKAAYKPKYVPIKTGRGSTTVELLPGQFIFGRFSAEEELGIDGSTIYKWMKKLQNEGMIEMESSSHYTIVSVCKWDDYQQDEEDEVTPKEQPSNTQVTGKEQPRNNQVTTKEQPSNTNKKVKESKESKEYKKSLLSEISISDFPELNFEYLEIAKSFQQLFKKNLTEAGAATKTIDNAKGTWIDDVRLMVESDKYLVEDFRAVYRFLQNDTFWKQNILSISKLREKMPQLKLKIYNNGTNKLNSKEATSWSELAEIASSIVNS